MLLRTQPTLFMAQNFWVRLVILALGSACTLAIPAKALYLLIIITLLYMAYSPVIYVSIARGLKTMLPFFATYAVLALIWNIEFPVMLLFIFRIANLVLLVSYFSSSLSIHRILEDIKPSSRSLFSHSLILYFLATLLFLKSFQQYYQVHIKSDKEGKKSISNLVPALIDAIHANWQKRDEIQSESEALLAGHYTRPEFINKANVAGCIYLTVLILILSV